ncbi:MAG: glutamate racemase, partial [Acidimicrobiales bacterium]
IGDVMGRDVVLVSSADETAFSMADELEAWGLARRPASSAGAPAAGPATHTFLSSGDVDWFRRLGRQLLGPELDHAGSIRWP